MKKRTPNPEKIRQALVTFRPSDREIRAARLAVLDPAKCATCHGRRIVRDFHADGYRHCPECSNG